MPKCFQLIRLPCEFLILCPINTINFNCLFVPQLILIRTVFIVLGLPTCTAQLHRFYVPRVFFLPGKGFQLYAASLYSGCEGIKQDAKDIVFCVESMRKDKDLYQCFSCLFRIQIFIAAGLSPTSLVVELKMQCSPSCRQKG